MFRRQDILARMEKLYPFGKGINRLIGNPLTKVKGMLGGQLDLTETPSPTFLQNRIIKGFKELKIDPSVIRDIQMDQELKLTMQELELDPAIFHLQFTTKLSKQQAQEIRSGEKSQQINFYYDLTNNLLSD